MSYLMTILEAKLRTALQKEHKKYSDTAMFRDELEIEVEEALERMAEKMVEEMMERD